MAKRARAKLPERRYRLTGDEAASLRRAFVRRNEADAEITGMCRMIADREAGPGRSWAFDPATFELVWVDQKKGGT